MVNKGSILNSIKKLHGIEPADTSFDQDLILLINPALLALSQLGVGPEEGFYIEDEVESWENIIPDKVLASSVSALVYIKVRLVFDPPASPTVVDALKASANEYEWRIRDWVESHSS